ncbi:hypothetical protein POVWA2_040030 [Plasmodium ovale wallikeri]|uniref:Uncharacterized protein n=1 Tax=Plasmodium ovale wallikeri TaxID=864142 RepID=A0A1A8Z9T3_PLAOA|nr:hypothetical protein POVWA1_041470 [Plasmodium ovale wallikeri]SBT40594.1 hypothetical protein POVWA2_040030 [Plasmodium ovale wallikeri]
MEVLNGEESRSTLLNMLGIPQMNYKQELQYKRKKKKENYKIRGEKWEKFLKLVIHNTNESKPLQVNAILRAQYQCT